MSVELHDRPAETGAARAAGPPAAGSASPHPPTVDIVVILCLIGAVYGLARVAVLWNRNRVDGEYARIQHWKRLGRCVFIGCERQRELGRFSYKLSVHSLPQPV